MFTSRNARIAVAVAAVALGLSACNGSSDGGGAGNAIANQQQAADSRQAAYVQPIPFFPFSQIRQTVIEAEAIDALGIASTTFDFVPGIDHPVLSCPSVGVPVPATDELSNPVVAQWKYSGSDGVAGVGLGQQEPDGIFPGDTTGTNGLCLNSAANQFLNYDEAYTIAVTAPAYWDTNAGNGQPAGHIQLTGSPVMPKCRVKILNAAKHKAEEVCTK